MHEFEAALLKKIDEKNMVVAEMKIKLEMKMKIIEASKKIQESRLRWDRHLRRRDGEDHVGRKAI